MACATKAITVAKAGMVNKCIMTVGFCLQHKIVSKQPSALALLGKWR